MRYLLTSDIHANLVAAESALALGDDLSVDEIIHLGDSIAIGPWPCETLDCFKDAGVRMLKGNHEEDAFMGLHPEREIGPGEALHIEWLDKQLRPDQVEFCRNMPHLHSVNESIRLQHFALGDYGRISKKWVELDSENLPQNFSVDKERLIIIGHIHRPFDIEVRHTRFYSFGTSGCVMKTGLGKQAALLETKGNTFSIEPLTLNWQIEDVIAEYKAKKVPAADEVIDLFHNSSVG